MPRVVDLPTSPKDTRVSAMAAGTLGAVAAGEADTVEDQALGRQGLGLSHEILLPAHENRRPTGRLFRFHPPHQ